MSPRVGVLALQGDFAAHAAALRRASAESVEVRVPDDLRGCAALVIPGGESTTLLRLMEPHRWDDAIRAFHDAGGLLYGTCAGAILLATEVRPAQRSVGLIDVTVERNAYGRQRESFEASARPTDRFPAQDRSDLPMLFIRAPRIVAAGPDVEILATWRDDVVLARQGSVVVCTAHPELTGDLRVPRFLVELAGNCMVAPQVRGRFATDAA